jgi:adenine-specific DNA-methyltransferase
MVVGTHQASLVFQTQHAARSLRGETPLISSDEESTSIACDGTPSALAEMRTQLVWEGKFDERGHRRRLDVADLTLPLQRIETIDQPRSRAEGRLDDFRNRLIWGDNKLVMASLLSEFRSSVKLIYIDPPFDAGGDFTMNVPLGNGDKGVRNEQSVLEMVAYRDMWGRGTDSYLHMLYERLVLIRELLTDDGSVYVHCDWRLSHHVRELLDEVFGAANFRNSIVWAYGRSARGAKAIAAQFARNHDDIISYSKTKRVVFNGDTVVRVYTEDEARKAGFRRDEHGVWFKTAPRGDYTDASIEQLEAQGRIHRTRTGGIRIKYLLEQRDGKVIERVPVGDVWTDIPDAMHMSEAEQTRFATQKPEALLERIVNTASNGDDLVADFFCGSGTTLAVAERLGRRWIGADLGRFAIHTSYKRLIGLQRERADAGRPYRAFELHNLGRYERQWWQRERLRGDDGEYRRLVLKLYNAEHVHATPSPLLHGRKAGALVHVAGIDSIFTRTDLERVAEAAQRAGATRLTCLAWEFETNLRASIRQLELEHGVAIRLLQIPREIMENNRTQVTFFEVAALEAEPVYGTRDGRRTVDVRLTSFIPSLAEVPGEEPDALKSRALHSGFDFIDFWAVAFEYAEGRPFNHDWQAYRLPKDRSLPTVSDRRHTYAKPGRYLACVKVVDVFGCDTSITLPIDAS